MTFFLAAEPSVNSSLAGHATPGSSTYGVRSLDSSIGSEPKFQFPQPDTSEEIIVEGLTQTLERLETSGDKEYGEDTDLDQGLHEADTSFDTTFTPHEHSRNLTRTPSLNPSFRHMPSNSDLGSLYSEDHHFSKSPMPRSYPASELHMDDGNSAIADDQEDTTVTIIPKDTGFTEISAPQLIMPTIRMPSRRPFTDRGKGISRLKILIAGDSG